MGRIDQAIQEITHELERKKEELSRDRSLKGFKIIVRFDDRKVDEIAAIKFSYDHERVPKKF